MSDSQPDLKAASAAMPDLIAQVRQALGTADQALVGMIDALIADHADLQETVIRLKKELVEARALADRDPLCPTLNARAFRRELEREIARAKRHDRYLATLFIDLDNFKQFNDTHGHQAGDRILVQMAATLLANVRQSDLVARMGGDEFAVLLLETDEESALALAETLRLRLARASEDGVTASIGAASWAPGISASTLLAQADEAMFKSKPHAKTHS